jgi:hypothetical protein
MCVPESHVPVWPPVFGGQSVLEQHPFEATQIPAVGHCLGVDPPQVNPQFIPSQVAELPPGVGQASQREPQLMVEVLSTQPLGHMCWPLAVQAGVVPPAPAVPVVPPLPLVPAAPLLPLAPVPADPVAPAAPTLPPPAPVPAVPPARPPVPPVCPPAPPAIPPLPLARVPPAPPCAPALPSGPPSTGT